MANGSTGNLFWVIALTLTLRTTFQCVLSVTLLSMTPEEENNACLVCCSQGGEIIKYEDVKVLLLLLRTVTLTVGLLWCSLNLLGTSIGNYSVHWQKFDILVRPVENSYLISSSVRKKTHFFCCFFLIFWQSTGFSYLLHSFASTSHSVHWQLCQKF